MLCHRACIRQATRQLGESLIRLRNLDVEELSDCWRRPASRRWLVEWWNSNGQKGAGAFRSTPRPARGSKPARERQGEDAGASAPRASPVAGPAVRRRISREAQKFIRLAHDTGATPSKSAAKQRAKDLPSWLNDGAQHGDSLHEVGVGRAFRLCRRMG